jgi:hypothetical protein
LEAQELHPLEPDELTVPPFPPALLKLQADRSLSIVQDPHWGHFSGNFPPNTSSSKVLLQFVHLNSKIGISLSHLVLRFADPVTYVIHRNTLPDKIGAHSALSPE